MSGFSNCKDGMKPGRWNQKTNREELQGKKCDTKSEYLAKQQTTQSSRVTAGQNIQKESTIWLIAAWKGNLFLGFTHQCFLHRV